MSNSQMQLLLIEDNKGDARLIQELLKETSYANWELKWKETLEAGLQELETDYFDLILLDLALPDCHGLETVSRIVSQAPNIPVIVMTGNNDDVIAKAAVSAGAQDYLIKGEVNTRILERSINYAIERNTLIKDRVQSEETLHESQKQALLLADLLKQSSQPFAIRCLDGRLSIYNAAFCKLVGYTKEELNGFNAIQLTPPEWLEREKVFLDELKDTGQTVHYEKEYIRKDGTRIPVEALVHLIKDDLGQPERYYAFITDISERKQMADALRERDIRLAKLASQVPGMLYQFMKRPDGSYCVPFTTEAIKNIFGCSPQDVVDDFSPIANVILPEDLDSVIRSIEDSAEYLTLWQCEYRVHVPGRQIRWLWGSSMPEKLADGSIIWHGYNSDITERKQASEALQASEDRLKTLISNAPIGIATSNPSFYFESANDAFCNILGYREDELQRMTFKDITHPDDLDDSLIKMKELVAGNIAFFNQEKRYLTKDGAVIFGRIVVSLIRDRNGNPSTFFALLEDITKVVKFQNELRLKDFAFRSSITPEAIMNLKGFITNVNESFVKTWGYDSDNELLGKHISECHANPSESEIAIDAAETTGLWSGEYIAKKKDGSTFIALAQKNPVLDKDGNQIALYTSVMDITDRKRAEEENRFKSILLDSAMDSVFVYDERGNFQYVNEAAYKDLGYSKEELYGMTIRDLLVPEVLELMEQRIAFTMEHGEARFESTHLRKDGTIMPVEVYTKIINFQGRDIIFSICRDVTERRQAEEDIRFRSALLDSAIDSVFVHDEDGNFYYINETAYRSRGYTRAELMAMNLHYLDAPEFAALIEPRMEDLKSTKGATFESAHVCKDGTIMPVEVHAGFTTIHGQEVIFSVVRDITERKQADMILKNTIKELKEERDTLEGIMESSDNPVFSVDTNYCYTSFNKSHAATMKALYSADIELGKNILDYQTVKEDRVTAKINLDRALHGERLVDEAYSGEEELTRSYFEVSHNPIKDAEGNIVGVAVTARDITAIKNAQIKIENLARFPAENPNAVLRVSKDGTLLYANPGSEILLKTWDCTVGENVPAFVKIEMDLAWASENVRENEISAIDHVFSIVFVPFLDHGYVNMYAQDITELRNTQQSLIRLNEELEVRVEERTKALKEAQERMMRQEKLAAIGKLAGSVGHELRNPLGVITNSIYYLGMKLPTIDEKIKKHLNIIQEESTRANKIISELLDFARTKNNETIMVDINSLINQTLERTQKPDNITVTTCLTEHLPNISIDPGKMQQAFQNIIVNAFQAMPDGGALEITDIYDDDVIEITFKDTGVGISPENLQRLFEPLFSTKIKGIGLGLSITKEIVELYKGKIEVESEVGVGSIFRVKLPINE